jgi:acetyltransferase-like isoleucine patch superfamily enzyme
MLDQPLLLEPLLRLMPLPRTLMRQAPLSAERRLFSVPVADTPMAQHVGARFDDTCWLTLAEGMDPADLPVKLAAHGGKKRYTGVHLTVLSQRGQFKLVLGGDHAKVFIGTDAVVRATIQLLDEPTLFIGDATTIGAQSRLVVNQADLVIGTECQLVDEVLVQCNDPYPMIDLSNGQLLGPARQRIYLGRHVLVNRRVVLNPGVRIGDGAIIQAGAAVVHDVPPNTLVGGAPAVVLREQVAWERDRRLTADRTHAKASDAA